jgi:hypothetical protein
VASITNELKEKEERKYKNISPERRKRGKWDHRTWKNENGGRGPSGGHGRIMESSVRIKSVAAASRGKADAVARVNIAPVGRKAEMLNRPDTGAPKHE